MMLEQKLKSLGEENLEVHLVYKNHLGGIAAVVIWHDPEQSCTFKSERLIRFCDLRDTRFALDSENLFETNLSRFLGNMATKVLERVERYRRQKEEQNGQT